MGTLSEFLVGDTPVMTRAGFADIPDMAAQIEPTMSPRKRSIARSWSRSVYPMRQSPGRHRGACRHEDRLASVFDGSPQNHAAKAARRSFDLRISH
jgi:hypothetical protein